MEFQEADRRYADLRQRYDNGSLSAEEFDARLEQIMIQGTGDRWWAKSRETGEWHFTVDGGGTWVRSAPPGYHRDPGTDERVTQTPPEQPRVRQQPPAQGRPGLWIAGGVITALAGITIIPFPFSWLLYFLGVYFGYGARQKGSAGGGTAIIILNGVCLLLELGFYIVSGCTTLACY